MDERTAPAERIDPEIREAQRRMAERCPPYDITALPIDEARRRMTENARYWADGAPPVRVVEDIGIPGATGLMRGRLFQHAPDPKGTILFIHGGGWATGSIDTHERSMRVLADASGMSVVGIDYRLTPEHPYPAGLEDCIGAWRFIAARGPTIGLDVSGMFVTGDSAGGNLALALALRERDEASRPPDGLILNYGTFTRSSDTESHRLFGDGRYGLSTARMAWYWDRYLPGRDTDPYAEPLTAPLEGLPPTYIAFAELDCVASDSRLLAAALKKAGVEHELVEWQGAVHGFLQMSRDVRTARDALAAAGAWAAEKQRSLAG